MKVHQFCDRVGHLLETVGHLSDHVMNMLWLLFDQLLQWCSQTCSSDISHQLLLQLINTLKSGTILKSRFSWSRQYQLYFDTSYRGCIVVDSVRQNRTHRLERQLPGSRLIRDYGSSIYSYRSRDLGSTIFSTFPIQNREMWAIHNFHHAPHS